MSTKTSIKRIALVAVSALGFGLLSVVPAKAGLTSTALTLASADADESCAVGAACTFAVTVTTTGTPTQTDDAFTITPTVTSRPDGSSLAVAAAGAATTTNARVNLTKADNPTAWTIANSTNNLTLTAGATPAALTGVALTTVTVIPDVPGNYTVTLTPSESDAAAPTLTAVTLTVRAGFSIDSLRANRAFALQGTNVTSGWSGVDTGLVTARITGFSSSTTVTYYVTAQGGVINSYTEREAGGTVTGDTLSAFTNTNGSNLADGFFFTSASSQPGDAVDVQLNPTDGGTTASITVVSYNATTGVSSTHVVATVSLGTAPAASAQYSSEIIAAGSAAAGASDAVGVSALRTATARVANITVTIRDQNNNVMPTAGLSATITGPGLLAIDDEDVATSTSGTGRSVALTTSEAAGNNGIANISVFADGTAGVATITISSGTTVLGTETVTFYGTVATLEVTQYMSVAEASTAGRQLGYSGNNATFAAYDAWNGTTFTQGSYPAVLITAKDANGNVVPNLTISAVSSNSAVIALGTVAEDTAGAINGPGYYNASVTSAVNGVSGASATVTFRTQLSTGAFITSSPLTFTLGKRAANKVTFSFDKTSYEAGELMKFTQTAVDDAGNPVADGTQTALWSATPVFSKPVVGSLSADVRFLKGVRTLDVYAPVLSGPFTVRATANNVTLGYYGTVSSGGSTVGADASSAAANAAADAAAEAIDAANAATDAANLAAEAADAATVAAEEARDAADAATAAVEKLASDVATLMASLKAQITTLANTVAKIAKKVKA